MDFEQTKSEAFAGRDVGMTAFNPLLLQSIRINWTNHLLENAKVELEVLRLPL